MLQARAIPLEVLLLSVLVYSQAAVQQVATDEAAKHLQAHPAVSAPPLAKAAHVGGTVELRVRIDVDGSVHPLRVISGHPMLAGAAQEAVKQWHYEPFIIAGKATAVESTVDVVFPGGLTNSESTANEDFFATEDKCRVAMRAKDYPEAEKLARRMADLSQQLPAERILEREDAQSLLGNALYLQGKFDGAKPYYEAAVKLRQKVEGAQRDADMASCYQNLGRDLAQLGELQRADELYGSAEKTFEAAILNLPAMRANYMARYKRALLEHAQIKDLLEDAGGAAALKQRADSLQVP